MTTYSIFISKLRAELKDKGTFKKDVWDGDATTLNFPASSSPILEDSYTVRVGGVIRLETTDYTLDKDTGLLSFIVAPPSGSDNVEMTYRAVKFRDNDFIESINDAIDHFQWKFWKEATNETSITTIKDQYEYDLTPISPNVQYVLNVWYKASGAATVWTAVSSLTNWKYSTRQNRLFVNPAFSTPSLPLKFLYLVSFTKGTTTSATIDIPDKYLLPYKYFIYARFFERLGFERINEIGAVSQHPFFLNAPNVINISELYFEKARRAAERIAPKLPPEAIKSQIDGIII